MKKAAILTAFAPEQYRGGIETFIINLRNLLIDCGISVDIHYAASEPTLPLKPFPLKWARSHLPEHLLRCFMLGRVFAKIQSQYDLVITHNFYGLGYFAPRVKSVVVYHSTHAGYADALKDSIDRRFYRELKFLYGHIGDRLSGKGKTIIAVSSSVKDELKRYYGFRDVTVINHGIDTDFYKKLPDKSSLRNKWQIPHNAFAGIFPARWEAGKGIDIMEKVIQGHPSVLWLLVVGDSECPLNGCQNVKVIKNADAHAMRELYSLSDFMLFPSHYEGFGLVIIEALACELPVIYTPVGVAKNLVRFDTLHPFLVSAENEQELIARIDSGIAHFKENQSNILAIADAARSIVEREFNLASWKNRFIDVLQLKRL